MWANQYKNILPLSECLPVSMNNTANNGSIVIYAMVNIASDMPPCHIKEPNALTYGPILQRTHCHYSSNKQKVLFNPECAFTFGHCCIQLCKQNGLFSPCKRKLYWLITFSSYNYIQYNKKIHTQKKMTLKWISML